MIIPLLLYHGRDKWDAPDRLWKLAEGGDEFKEYIPDFSFELYSLADYEDESLLVGDFVALGVVLYLMKHIFDRDFAEVFVRAMQYLARIRDQRMQLEFIELALRYAFNARRDDKAHAMRYIEKGIEQINEEDTRRLAMSVADQLRQEGFEEGEKYWRTKEKKELYVKMIKGRFGCVSPGLMEKLENADINALDKFGDIFFDFEDLKNVENWWDKN